MLSNDSQSPPPALAWKCPCLTKSFRVHLVMESHDERFSDQVRRCSKVSSWAKNEFQDFFFGGIVFFQVDINSLFTFSDHQFRRFGDQF